MLCNNMTSSTETIAKAYAKRPGTSGVRGHLYETKLLSLIYFRAIHDDSIEEFHLATNVDKLGSFDDICFRAKVKGLDKPIVVFIQAKHRENNSILTLNSKSDLVKYFNSYLEIRHRFQANSKDVLFEGTFNETECVFVIYTTAKGGEESVEYKTSYAKYLNALIGTGDPGSQLTHDVKNFNDFLCKMVLENQITALAINIAKCIFEELNIQMLMQDEHVLRYHVVLAEKVFDISVIQSEGHRIARFRQDFFDMHEGYFKIFKDKLCTEILKRRKIDYEKKIMFLFSFLTLRESSDIEGLYKNFESGIIYENGKFEFREKNIPGHCKHVLEKINKSQETIRKTVELAVKECLPSLEFKVPAAFGNKDLTIRGGEDRIERKLRDLTSTIKGLIEKSPPNKIITIDECMGKGFLQLSGGIASAVGNLLIADENSELLKFNDNYKSLGKLGKKLFDKLKSEINNLNEYKFYFKVEVFPKLSFSLDEYDKKIPIDFLDTLVLYTTQSNEIDVEKTLINEISNSQRDDVQNVEITANAVFLKFHDEIQKWWITSEMVPYLAKEGTLFNEAVKFATSQPLIIVLSMIQRLKTKNYSFTEFALKYVPLDDHPSGAIVITDNSEFTVALFARHLNNQDFLMLDLEHILNLSPRDDKTLHEELTNTNIVKIIIVGFDKTLITARFNKKIENFVNSIKNKIVFVVTDQKSEESAINCFSHINDVITEQYDLRHLTTESRKGITEYRKLIFQGNEVTLEQILDQESYGCVTGEVINKLIHSTNNTLGKSVSNSNDISKLYIERTVQHYEVVSRIRVANGISKRISTLYDIEDDIVLIIGDPGMGKSTLLTHLALETKKLNPLVWILRINLLEHSKQFSEWQKNNELLYSYSTLESLYFMCQVALSEETAKKDIKVKLDEYKDNFQLLDCTGDDWTAFELQMFLHYYNTKEIIILLDGFDEICPTYTYEVLTLIKTIKNWPHKHKMWITSRSYGKVLTILEMQFGKSYKILPLRNDEQNLYLTRFWDENINLEGLNDEQKLNIYDFSMFMSKNEDINTLMKKDHLSVKSSVQSKKEMPFLAIYLNFVKYLKSRISAKHFRKDELVLSNYLDVAESELYPKILIAINSVCNKIPSLFFTNFITNPLHLNMSANYLYNLINTQRNPNKWDLDTNIFHIYEDFLETKLKNIYFDEKYKTDLYKPGNLSVYKKIYKDVVDKHKKLAAYAVYDKYLFDEDELKEVNEIINELKEGEERTGIICDVVDDKPIFVHSTFAEYFAVEHIWGLLKKQKNTKSIWDFILNEMFFNNNINVLVTLDAKMKIDTELAQVVEKNKEIIFELLLLQGQRDDIKSSLCEAVRHNLRNLGLILFSTMECNLDENNLMDFIKIFKKTNLLIIAVKMEFEELIVKIVDQVRIIDKSKLRELFEYINTIESEDVEEMTTDDIIQKIHTHIWARMKIVPEWENLKRIVQNDQIYFI